MRSFCVLLTTRSANISAKKSSISLEFKDLLKERAKVVEMDASFMTRSVNERLLGRRKET
jgi:Fe-S cluster assembly ATPase SufC